MWHVVAVDGEHFCAMVQVGVNSNNSLDSRFINMVMLSFLASFEQ